MRTLRTLFWVGYVFVYMILRLPYSWRMKSLEKKGRLDERQKLVEQQVSLWARRLLRRVQIDVAVEGRENLPPPGTNVVYASNHQSFIDIPVLLGAIEPPPPLLARAEIGKVPILGFWMRVLGCVFVQREDARSGMAALKQAQELVEGGSSLIIFPEGTRSKGEQMNQFMPGAVRIASKAGVPVVPVAIDGTYKALEGNGMRLAKVAVRLRFLPPVETKGLSREEQKALPALLQEQVRQAKDAGKPGQLSGKGE